LLSQRTHAIHKTCYVRRAVVMTKTRMYSYNENEMQVVRGDAVQLAENINISRRNQQKQ